MKTATKKSNSKFKYGATAVVFTVVFVAAIIIFNVIFTALGNNYQWYFDLTKKDLTGVSDQSFEMLDAAGIENHNVRILFFQTEEEIGQNQYLYYMHECAKRYAVHYPNNIEIVYEDMILNPTIGAKYSTSSTGKPKTTSVVVETVDENGQTISYGLMAQAAFYLTATSDNSLYAFQGELKFTSKILQLIGKRESVYFTIGHGETVENASVKTLFENAGYDVFDIDLTKEDIPADARIVIVNNPQKDFAGASAPINEIKKLDDFLDNHGNLILFRSPDISGLTELDEYLEEWNIRYENTIIKDEENSLKTQGGYQLIAQLTDDGSAGAMVHQSLRESGKDIKTIVEYASPIRILYSEKGSTTTSAVLKTYPTAAAYSGETQVEKGEFNLMTLSRRTDYVENEMVYSCVLAVSSANYADNDYITSNAYANNDILYSAMELMGREQVPVDIDWKRLEDNELDITTAAANNWTLVLSLVLPTIVFVVGMVVFARRRHL